MKTLVALGLAAAALTFAAPVSAAGCPAPGDLYSFNSDDRAGIVFTNATDRTLQLYWLDFRGDRRFYFELKPGESRRQATYMTHPWLAVDQRGNCVGPAVMASRAGVDNPITFRDR
jgi:hypothetical protein